MVSLKDYLGTIVSELASARAASDLHTLEIATAFAEDEDLAGLTMPKFRFGEIKLDIPYLVSSIDTPAVPAAPKPPARPHMPPDAMTDIVVGQMARSVGQQFSYTLTPSQRDRLSDSVEALATDSFKRRDTMTVDLAARYSLKASQTLLDVLKKAPSLCDKLDAAEHNQTLRTIDENIRNSWIYASGATTASDKGEVKPKKPTPVHKLNILADHGSLKEFGSTENIARIQMTLHEEEVAVKRTLHPDGTVSDRIVRSD